MNVLDKASPAYAELARDAMRELGLSDIAALTYVCLRQAGTGHSIALGYVQRKYGKGDAR